MGRNESKARRELQSTRDTFESIWVAIVVAFVLRAFVVEAFVIPTGSMAPRLYGEHLQLTCPACGYSFAHGRVQSGRRARGPEDEPAPDAVCPTCGSRLDGRRERVRGGDRVLVMKYLYNYREPQPWDVVVFKNPQDNRQSYIKRLVGRPGEMIEIVHGNIFYRAGKDFSGDGVIDEADFRTPEAAADPDCAWRIRRKAPEAQQAMWQVVFDNDYQPDREVYERLNAGRGNGEPPRPPRWRETAGHWDQKKRQDSGGRVFYYEGDEAGELTFEPGDRSRFLPHYGYNQRTAESRGIDEDRDIVTDLQLSLVFRPESRESAVSLMLTSFEQEFIAEVHGDGTVLLSRRAEPGGALEEWGRAALGALEPGRGVDVALAHADYRVELWMDGERVLASTPQQYDANYARLKARMEAVRQSPIPTPRAGISTWGGKSQLWHLRLMRDVYYTSPRTGLDQVPEGAYGDYFRKLRELNVIPSDPAGWGTTNNPIVLAKHPDRDHDLDEFFMLGDNSPQSLDGRLWSSAAPTLRLWRKDGQLLPKYEQGAEPIYKLGTVPRYSITGKALFVYWPSGFPVPGLRSIPIVPNVGRMRFIR